jgi:hypothetical protein
MIIPEEQRFYRWKVAYYDSFHLPDQWNFSMIKMGPVSFGAALIAAPKSLNGSLDVVASRKSPREIVMRIPLRDCMTEGRITTHGWGACTSVEGTRAPSMGDAIERTIDLARPPWEKSSLGQNRVTVYSFPTVTTLARGPK